MTAADREAAARRQRAQEIALWLGHVVDVLVATREVRRGDLLERLLRRRPRLQPVDDYRRDHPGRGRSRPDRAPDQDRVHTLSLTNKPPSDGDLV